MWDLIALVPDHFLSLLLSYVYFGIFVTLTLKALITFAADDIHKYFSLFFRENKT